jgi:hypothetical protein
MSSEDMRRSFFLGHAHVTDFNIAAVLESGQLATAMSGTKPYMGKLATQQLEISERWSVGFA